MKRAADQKGFTMVELIIVIALMGIISAALMVNYKRMVLSSQLSVDIHNVRLAQEQVEMYYAEYSQYPGGGGTAENIIAGLVSNGYLVTGSSDHIPIKTPGAKVIWDAGDARLKLKVTTVQYNMVKDPATRNRWLTY